MKLSLLSVVALWPLQLAAQPSYLKDIAPLLEKRCGGCHGGEAKMGELSVNTFASLKSGGNHGNTVVPGKPDESLLYQTVTGKSYPKMPMDGTTLSDAEANLIREWIAAGGKGPANSPYFAMAWQPGGRLVALAGHKTVTLTDPKTKKTVATLGGHADAVRAVAFSHDGKLLAAAGGLCAKQGEVKVWDVETRKPLYTIKGHSDCIYGLAFSPDGRMLATSSYDKLIKLWDASNGNEMRTLKDHIDAVYALEFSPDGKRLVSGGADRTVKIWDPATGQRLYTFSDALDGINTFAIDPSGRYVAAGGLDKIIRVWRMDEKGGELVNSLMAHEDSILKIVWSPDGKTIASSSADRTIKLLRASDLTELKVLPNQPDWAYGLQFSPDGRQIAAGSMNGTLKLIDEVTP